MGRGDARQILFFSEITWPCFINLMKATNYSLQGGRVAMLPSSLRPLTIFRNVTSNTIQNCRTNSLTTPTFKRDATGRRFYGTNNSTGITISLRQQINIRRVKVKTTTPRPSRHLKIGKTRLVFSRPRNILTVTRPYPRTRLPPRKPTNTTGSPL